MEVVSLLLPFLSPLFFSVHNANALSASEKPYFEAIYQFGDSISDTGNLIRQNTYDFSCARPPYGETFFQHPTGRCSDGRLMIDFFAEALGLPFLDPYLDENGNFTHGVNFAVAGASALNYSTLAAKNIRTIWTNNSLLVQLDWFNSYINALPITPSERKEKLGKALFVVGEIGGNDYNYATLEGKGTEEQNALVPEVIQTITYAVEELINFGAKRIIVPGNFPLGCMTFYLYMFRTNDSTMYDELNCLRGWNEFALRHNGQLQDAIRDLQKKHRDVAIVYGDYYTAFRSILKYAPLLGFESDPLLKQCCGGRFPNKPCGIDGATVCTDPSKRVSWDGVHLTQHAYQLMASWLLKDIIPSSIQVA